MCGRYSLYTDDYDKFYSEFELTNRLESLPPRYNITPGMNVPVITKQSPKKVEMMNWGLIPFWSKDPKIGYRTINARAEGIETKPAFRIPLKSQRCLVPSSGFFEWKRMEKDRIPFYIKLKNKDFFAFAGLYDIWKDAEGHPLKSFTIITTSPNPLMEKVHNRMPVILDNGAEDKWLDKNTPLTEILKMLVPLSDRKMSAYPVSKLVNNPANDNPQVIKPSNS